MADIEHRIARSEHADRTRNTIELYPGPRFAILELLDDRDSQYFRNFLKKRGWAEITPDEPKKKKTYYWTRPEQTELQEYHSTVPEWFYLSGHFARTTDIGMLKAEKKSLNVLPAGFFNEPFHKKEWLSAWTKEQKGSLFLQAETLTAEGATAYRKFMDQHWIPAKSSVTSTDAAQRSAAIADLARIWEDPVSDRTVGDTNASALRGALFGTSWPTVKVLLLVGCNTLTFPKTVFSDAFPNAVVLGYTSKNPANGTPHIARFLKYAFRDIHDPRDPRLQDKDHIAQAWIDVFRKTRMRKSERMIYMMPDGNVFGVAPDGKTVEKAGTREQTIGRKDKTRHFRAVDDFFGIFTPPP